MSDDWLSLNHQKKKMSWTSGVWRNSLLYLGHSFHFTFYYNSTGETLNKFSLLGVDGCEQTSSLSKE